MKYWYFVFDYSNHTIKEKFTFKKVICSDNDYFPLREAWKAAYTFGGRREVKA